MNKRLVPEFDVEVIEVDVTLDTYVDRIAIAQVTSGRRQGPQVWPLLIESWLDDGLPDVFQDSAFAHLRLAHERLWDIKDALDDGFLRHEPLQRLTPICRSLYLVNDTRCRSKQEIALANGAKIVDRQEKPAYRLPQTWREETLSWLGGEL